MEIGWDGFITCESIDFGGFDIYDIVNIREMPTNLYMPTVTATIILSDAGNTRDAFTYPNHQAKWMCKLNGNFIDIYFAEGDDEKLKTIKQKHPIWSYRQFSFIESECSGEESEGTITGEIR